MGNGLTRRRRPRMRCSHWAVRVGVVVAVSAAWMSPGSGSPEPAGSTAAVLSFIDAAAGRVEVVRHWPEGPAETPVYPFVPYFWDGCPGPGAIMMLITGAAGGLPSAARIAGALLARPPRDPSAQAAIVHVVEKLRTPGDPALEALKAAVPWVSDLASYERWGYAVFLFIRWQGVRCALTLEAVPEGYGIPFVR